MADPQTLLAILLLAGSVLWQARRLRGGAADRRAWRAGYFDLAQPLVAQPRTHTQPDGFARLTGTLDGAPIDLRVVPDTLTPRKLPALWLLVTLPEPNALSYTWHLMLRPRGTEVFSTFDRLPRLLPPDPSLPEDCAIRTDAPSGEPPALIADILARLGEGRLKEVVLSPKGLRLTWLAEEAPRASYLIFRDAEMGKTPIDPATVSPLLEALHSLRAALAAQPQRLRA